MPTAPFERVDELILSVASGCNLACGYCYRHFDPAQATQTMTPELAGEAVAAVAAQSRAPTLAVTLHGGEPLLLEAARLERLCAEIVAAAGRAGKAVDLALQTNLTLLSDGHLDLIERHRIRVGVSLDGVPAVNDVLRAGGQLVVRNLRRLLARAPHLCGGVLAVLNRHNLETCVEFALYLAGLGCLRGSFNPCSWGAVGAGRWLDGVDSTALTRARVRLIEYHQATGFAAFREANTLVTLARFLFPEVARETIAAFGCRSPFCGAAIRLIEVLPDGSMYPCGPAVSADRRFWLGNVRDPSGWRVGAVRRRFHAKGEHYARHCRSCPARRICDFGCTAVDGQAVSSESLLCVSTRQLWGHLERHRDEFERRRDEVWAAL